MSTPNKEALAEEAVEQLNTIAGTERRHALKVILSAIDKATEAAQERPRIHNLKMLDAIHQVVIEYSDNKELADKVWSHLRADQGKGAIAPPASRAAPDLAKTPSGKQPQESA